MHLPKKISPDPVVDAVIEIRFNSDLPSDAIFGIVYSNVQSDFNKVEQLPILQMPEIIRNQDPGWKYQPYYSLHRSDNMILKVGPRVLTFSNTGDYVGWDSFSTFAKTIVNKLKDSKVITEPERVGLRYVSLFKYPILDNLNVTLTIGNQSVNESPINIRQEIFNNNIIRIIQIAHNSKIKSPQYNDVGSLIDLDVIYNFGTGSTTFFSDFEIILDQCHKILINQFYSLLKPEFINQLNPTY